MLAYHNLPKSVPQLAAFNQSHTSENVGYVTFHSLFKPRFSKKLHRPQRFYPRISRKCTTVACLLQITGFEKCVVCDKPLTFLALVL